QQRAGALTRLGEGQPVDLAPVDLEQLAATPGDPAADSAHRELGDLPVVDAVLLHRRVHDAHPPTVLADRHRPVQQLAQYQQLAGPPLEAPHVHRAGAERDGVALDARDPSHWDEDAMPVQQFDDEPEHARRLPPDPEGGDGLAYPADLITVRIEDADAR